MAGLIVALDTADLPAAVLWARAVSPFCSAAKVGLELFCAQGHAATSVLAGLPMFLDLKLHDIPATAAGAVRAVLTLAPAMLTMHAAGGAAMMEAVRDAAEGGGIGRPKLLAVTVLTSLGAEALHATGVAGGPRQQVLRLARLALSAGADGLVCSPHEVAPLRDAFGAGPLLVVPGVRPAGAEATDQARISTPADAARAGADFVVVGRPITQAPDPAAAAAAIARELAGESESRVDR